MAEPQLEDRREFEALKLRGSPLALVLAQIRFSPILEMGDYIASIQKQLRALGLTRFKEEQVQEVVLGAESPVKPARKIRWLFGAADKTDAVVLSTDFVVFETGAYDVFESFLESFGKVARIVQETGQASQVVRVGLRYVDVIRPRAGEDFTLYLRPSICGLSPSDLSAEQVLNQSACKARTEFGTLMIRTFQSNNGRFMPPDLSPDELSLGCEVSPGELVTTLDLDHFALEEFSFDLEEVEARMWNLHRGTDRAFRSTTTEEGRKIWEEKSD